MVNLDNSVSTIERIAERAHEVNRGWQEERGEEVSPVWADAPEWQKASIRSGVAAIIKDPLSTAEESHNRWLALKLSEGWTYGPVKDNALKQHPCMLAYKDLPLDQKAKGHLFRAVVLTALKELGRPNAAGHRQLNPDQVARLDKINRVRADLQDLVNEIAADTMSHDGRWRMIATTQFQQGFMALVRAVTRPDTF